MYSYIVKRDYGFAPNPFFGFCTLATCKPKIRTKASIGDWIWGTGAATGYQLRGHLIYAMKVAETLSFTEYWNDPRFAAKKPLLNGSLKQLYGDNIYHRRGSGWFQADSHHSHDNGRLNQANTERDTGVDRILVSTHFVYFGREAPQIPQSLRHFGSAGEDVCHSRQGHRIVSTALAHSALRWLESMDLWGVQGQPLEFSKHRPRTR
ncbi:MAG: hypothetical protein KF696_01270 [Planctomycetes bacterium]|nr:hypothetical protein [Planctomycetota bacterium]MCW8134430.1 hypothetical protein [Planctomycetota bacterium]